MCETQAAGLQTNNQLKNCYKGHYYQSFTNVQHRKLCLKQFYSNETYGLTKAKFFFHIILRRVLYRGSHLLHILLKELSKLSVVHEEET